MRDLGATSDTGDTTGHQPVEGGSIPTVALQTPSLNFRVEEARFSEIRTVFERFHYKRGHMGGGISICYSAKSVDGLLLGGMVVGKPRHAGRYKGLLEIRRMALLDICPKNSESRFLSVAIRLLKRKFPDYCGVLSYADETVGHQGTIYKAANFCLTGKTSPSLHVWWHGKRYHPRSLTIERPYSYRLREAMKSGEARLETGKPKSIWEYRWRTD